MHKDSKSLLLSGRAFLWQAHCWKQKLCRFTQHEQSESTVQSLKSCYFLGKLRKVAGKFCIRYKGYVNLQGRSDTGILWSKWEAFIQHDEFPGEKNKTYWNILLQRNQGIGRILESAFKVSNSQQLRQTAFLSSAAPSKLSHTNRSLTLHVYFFYQENRQMKILETEFAPNTSRADCILGVLFCLGFFVF